MQALTTGGFFVYIGGSSFVLQNGLQISQAQYATVFGVNAAAMMASSVVHRLFVMRTGPAPLRRIAMIVQTTSVVALVVVCLVTDRRPLLLPVWICLAGMTTGLGTYLPANSALAQLAGRRYGGTASAIGGGIHFLVGAAFTPLTGLLGTDSVLVMGVAMAVMFLTAGAVAIVRRQDGPATGAV
ncbi:hypothetical protein ACSDQ9_03440 [Aestuariimicrobium soli]|uniref:hypothetical protein n=1 Tax=Aestuariimicrobium soli TaxID=2035834 RepID=UPI003EBA405D